MIVNGMKLPARLVELMASGRWKRPADVSVLAEMTGAGLPEGFSFDPLEGMIRETSGMHKLPFEGYDYLYGYTSSRDLHAPRDPALLDVDYAVLIAGNHDEEAIALDYRESLDEPKVVCDYWSRDDKGLRWKVIASTFDEFADRLGL
jgi:hypothetical protein